MGGDFIRREPGRAAPEPATLFERGELRDLFGFVVRAARRRRTLAACIAAGFAAATIVFFNILPRHYTAESRIIALPLEGSPGAVRSMTGEVNLAPGAVEVIASDESLTELIHAHDLITRWEQSRSSALRLLDRVRGVEQEEPERLMLAYLRKNLKVAAKGGDVVISFDWPDPQIAFEVVQDAQERLLAERRRAELDSLERKAEAVEANVVQTKARIDAGVARIDAAVRARRKGARAATVRGLQADGRFGDLPDPRLAALRTQLIAQRKAVVEAEESQRKRVSDLNALLLDQRATLGPAHPAVLDTRDKLRAAEAEGARLEELRAREQDLHAQYVRAGGKEIELGAEPAGAWPAELKEDDAAMGYAKARVSIELSALQRLLDDRASAHVALASARASFAGRYTVARPARVARKPASPNPVLFAVAGVLGGVLVALFGAVAADLHGGVLRETWQARRLLDLPVLGEVPEP